MIFLLIRKEGEQLRNRESKKKEESKQLKRRTYCLMADLKQE
jgi:hypothetical protein